MPSDFDTLANEFASPMLQEHFGERDEQGELAAHQYKPPGNAGPIKIVGGILGDIEGGLEENSDTADVVSRERRTWIVPTVQLTAKKITELQYQAAADLGDEGEWPIDKDQSKWGKTMVVFSLVRETENSFKRFESGTV